MNMNISMTIRTVLLGAACLLSGCAAPARTYTLLASAAGSNCGISLTRCYIELSVSGGLNPTFSLSVDPGIPPSNATQPIEIFWTLPVGYAFSTMPASASPDGISFNGNPAFTDGYVTNAQGVKAPMPERGYHWTLKQGVKVDAKYSITFHEVGITTGQRWLCDPRIIDFSGMMQSVPPVSVSTVNLTCNRIPG